eukprot:CAMPEP_0177641042 /NCGR_PEP_ID=MMETSP0447-20121125/6862_1 /TAXON_ID=0 /ORGANISM="Stygamoeba regulata, Strain BSH-02190019" /LENGTH=204 /DNA_ID=CAMNT_0019143147 /DNA_START=13 /DNA_END=627 /DNA_ORIENTATION=-
MANLLTPESTDSSPCWPEETEERNLIKSFPKSLPSCISTEKERNVVIGIVKTSWNSALVDTLVGNFKDCCREKNIKGFVEVVVPGAFEIPYAAKKLLLEHQHIDALIGFGVLIKGETAHFEYISSAVVKGLMEVQLSVDRPILDGVLNCFTEEQARTRCLSMEHANSLAESAIYMASMQMNNVPIQKTFRPGGGSTPLGVSPSK